MAKKKPKNKSAKQKKTKKPSTKEPKADDELSDEELESAAGGLGILRSATISRTKLPPSTGAAYADSTANITKEP